MHDVNDANEDNHDDDDECDGDAAGRSMSAVLHAVDDAADDDDDIATAAAIAAVEPVDELANSGDVDALVTEAAAQVDACRRELLPRIALSLEATYTGISGWMSVRHLACARDMYATAMKQAMERRLQRITGQQEKDRQASTSVTV